MHPIRTAAAALLPPRAFLRRDRGQALYVSNLPALVDASLWLPRLEAAGFSVRLRPPLLFLSPTEAWRVPLLDWLNAASPLCAELAPLNGRPGGEADRLLWIEGIKRLEEPASLDDYERRVRQCAAVAMRTGREGGLLPDCAACLAWARRAASDDKRS